MCRAMADLDLQSGSAEAAKAIADAKEALRTKTFSKQQPFEEHMLFIGRRVPDTNFLVLGAKSRLNEIHRL
jgi:chemotaxis regulatin CheY-phosphate phosphatase CheZ